MLTSVLFLEVGGVVPMTPPWLTRLVACWPVSDTGWALPRQKQLRSLNDLCDNAGAPAGSHPESTVNK
jgi:hypothetical protein